MLINLYKHNNSDEYYFYRRMIFQKFRSWFSLWIYGWKAIFIF